MKKIILKRFSLLLFALSLAFVLMLAGCGQSNNTESENAPFRTPDVESALPGTNSDSAGKSGNTSDTRANATELYVRFGDDGEPFTMHLNDNETAAAIARYVGSADWRLPLYHFDDYGGWEVMQYYDIPSRYDIPSNPVSVTTEQAGTVYYSEPNRIVLFFGDAEIPGEYTQVGYFDVTEEFVSAVENNPVLEGWGNKMVLISAEE